MLTWFAPADIYCERTDASFWAEPMNALTNLAFIVAGLLLLIHKQPPARTLGVLIMLIGFGSFLFHTFANRLTGFLDVLFIGIYLLAYAWLWPKWVLRSGPTICALSMAALVLAITLASLAVAAFKPLWPDLPPGAYLGAWFYLIAIATLSATGHPKAGRWLWAAVGLFAVSIAARQMDLPLCDQTGGTHWLWHVINAIVLYASARGLLTATGQSNFKPQASN